MIVSAKRSSAFLDSIGVNTHTGSWGPTYGLPGGTGGDVEKVLRTLAYTGISRIRDTAEYAWKLPEFQVLAANGIKFSLFVSAGNGAADVQGQVALFAALAPAVISVEGPNESDNWPVTHLGQTGLGATRALQADLYTLVHANAALAGIPVIESSLGNAASYPALANLGHADFANTHSYFFGYDLTIPAQIPSRLAEAASVAPGLPVITTEAGWSTAASVADYGSVDEATQAKLTLAMLFDQFSAGISQTYLYQLMDEEGFDDFHGLFHQDGSPKPVATALHNLNAILKDSSPALLTTPSALDLALRGLPPTGQSALLQKGDGTFEFALWNEAKLWDRTTVSPVRVAPTPVSVDLGRSFGLVSIYDPLTSAAPIRVLHNVASLQVDVLDHPIIIEVAPNAVPSGPIPMPLPILVPATIAAVVERTIGVGSQRLAISISEDAWLGDAEFTISIDGRQVGGVLTATAAHGSSQADVINVAGDFGPGLHALGVTFLNDRYGGTTSTDRNLYVEGVTLDSVALPDASRALLANGTSVVQFGTPVAEPISLGSGPDTLVLAVSEDAWHGDAQYVIKVDGTQVGGLQTATASHAAGQSERITVKGDFGRTAHVLTVDFLNDAYGGSPETDRNLYIDSAVLNGTEVSRSALNLYSQGAKSLSFMSPGTNLARVPVRFDVTMSEDQWLGHAEYEISIDDGVGVTRGMVTAAHASGLSQTVSIKAMLTSGIHSLALSFLNDAYAGSPETDRNLYLHGIEVQGRSLPAATAELYNARTVQFDVAIA